jgi:ATP-dependent Clp protease ATP-binding subunit ClpC
VEPALEGGDHRGDPDEWRGRLVAMYRAWANQRNMQLSEVSGKAKEPPLLVVGGFGAYRTLLHEAGLHVLEMPGEERTVDRVTARIRVAAAPLGEIPPGKLHPALAAALSRAAPSNTLVRRYRNGASPLVRDMVAGWRTGGLDAVLQGDFDLIAAA